MKGLQELLERIGKHFGEGGRLRAAKPVFDAMDNFFFAPKTPTVAAPHVRDPLDVKRFMSVVVVALIPCVAASFYFFGLRVLAMIVVSYAAGGAVEVAFAMIRKEEINEGFLVTGLLFPLVLPPTLPLWMVGVSVAFGVLVGKEVFGGTGRNPFNPALVGRCFAALAYPLEMSSGWTQPVLAFPGRLFQYVSAADAVTGATPLAAAKAKEGAWEAISRMDLFWGNVSGSIGETSAIAVLIGGAFLLLTRVGNWRTVAGAVVGFLATAAILQWAGQTQGATPCWHLLAGGFLFGAFFMATDPVTSPITAGGKWIYGLLIGGITMLIRALTGYVEGAMFAILLGNIVAPVLDEVVFNFRLRRLPR